MSFYAIKCPNCGGSLDIVGGRQISSVTCKYCGSVLDMENEYKVLSKFSKVSLPSTPFRLGNSGKIKGVRFTIIGMVAYSCNRNITRGEDTWIDYMLHSPTHGYAWLSYEEGTIVFSRRTRKLPTKNMMSLEPKNRLEFDGKKYQFYERYLAYVTYVQGELTWIAKKGDVTTFFEAISPPFGLSYERSKNESEYFSSEYLDAKEIYESFGVKSIEDEEFNPLKPFSSPKAKVFAKVSFYFLLITLFILVMLKSFYNGSTVASDSFNSKEKEIIFHIDDSSNLIELDMNTNLRNDWTYFDISIQNMKTKEEVCALAKEISYYYGYSGGESWSEGSQDATAYFKVQKSGDYILKFSAPEYHNAITTRVVIKENVIRSYYFYGLLVFCVFCIVLYFILLGSHQTKLWAHLEDDDD